MVLLQVLIMGIVFSNFVEGHLHTQWLLEDLPDVQCIGLLVQQSNSGERLLLSIGWRSGNCSATTQQFKSFNCLKFQPLRDFFIWSSSLSGHKGTISAFFLSCYHRLEFLLFFNDKQQSTKTSFQIMQDQQRRDSSIYMQF